MGNSSSTITDLNKTVSNSPLIIERIISPNILVGVNKFGEIIKIDDKYYKLENTYVVGNKIEYLFESNINLTLEQMDGESWDGTTRKLFYKLNNGSNNLMGEVTFPYKKISMNTPNLDKIFDLQNK